MGISAIMEHYYYEMVTDRENQWDEKNNTQKIMNN